MNSPETDTINKIKDDIAQKYGGYQNFTELLNENCKTKLVAAMVNGLVDYVAIEYQRQKDQDNFNNELFNSEKKQS